MTKKSYAKNAYYNHTFRCTWTIDGEYHEYDFIYSGDVIDGIIACYKTVLWSHMPDFEVTLIESEEV